MRLGHNVMKVIEGSVQRVDAPIFSSLVIPDESSTCSTVSSLHFYKLLLHSLEDEENGETCHDVHLKVLGCIRCTCLLDVDRSRETIIFFNAPV